MNRRVAFVLLLGMLVSGQLFAQSGRHALALDIGRSLYYFNDPTLLELELNYRWRAGGLQWDTAFTWSTSMFAFEEVPLMMAYRLSTGPVFRTPGQEQPEGFWLRPRLFVAFATISLAPEDGSPDDGRLTGNQWFFGPELGLGYTLPLNRHWYIDPWLGVKLMFAPQEKGLYLVPLLCMYVGYSF
jgi:hypothetical protein